MCDLVKKRKTFSFYHVKFVSFAIHENTFATLKMHKLNKYELRLILKVNNVRLCLDFFTLSSSIIDVTKNL